MGIFQTLPDNNKIYRVHSSLTEDPFNEDFSVNIHKRKVKDQEGLKQTVEIIEIVPEDECKLP